MTHIDKKPGDTLFTSQPFAHILSSGFRGKLCDQCFKSASQLLKCSGCKLYRFCNTNCQRSAWKIHKIECQCLKQVSPNVPSDSVRLMLRLLILWKHGDHTTVYETVMGQKRCFQDFMSHIVDIKQDPKRTEELIRITQTLRVLTDNVIDLPSAEDILQVFGKMVVNTFSICDGEMQPVGAGVYLGASLLDHSCVPNAVAVFSGIELTVRCTEPISDVTLDKVAISYIEQLDCTADRRRQLEEQYYFRCECTVCLDEKRDLDLLGYTCAEQCMNKGCNEKGCRNSDSLVDSREKAVEAAKQVLENVNSLKSTGDWSQIKDQCEACETAVSASLRPTSVFRIHLAETLLDAAIQTSRWDAALEHGDRIQKAYGTFYPGTHPNLGVHLMKCGKIRLLLVQFEEALTNLQQAQSILRLTHGDSHALYRDLVALLDQCMLEIRAKGRH